MSSLHRRAAPAVAAAALVALLATGCQPEPAPTGTTPGASPTATSSSTPGTEPTESAGPAFSLPASCEELYSPDMLALLQGEIPPLNDPGTTMLSTENAVGLETLAAAGDTLRCSWGPPSERGISTNVTAITAEQRDELLTSLEQSGFSSEDLGEGTLHAIEQQTITLDDEVVTLGESHYLTADAWVATRFIQYLPEGYTQDIVASLWG